jgi:hypothetical protein
VEAKNTIKRNTDAAQVSSVYGMVNKNNVFNDHTKPKGNRMQNKIIIIGLSIGITCIF